MREFSILIRREPGLEGQWVAHCLNWDLVSQGDSPAHAMRMIAEAIGIAIVEDSQEGLDADDRPSAPADLWELFKRTQHEGTRIAAADVDTLAARSGDVVIASVLYIQQIRVSKGAVRTAGLLESTPPPFMIAALRDDHPLL